MKNNYSGFTLIEVMITVAVVAILAAIALPSYNQYVIRSRITESINSLSTAKVGMEQFYQDNGSYETVVGSKLCGAGTPIAMDGFTFTCASTATTYLVTMTGSGTVAGYEYTIDNFGKKATVASKYGANAGCWLISSATC
jgi:type IV pilus assembly protein PilE